MTASYLITDPDPNASPYMLMNVFLAALLVGLVLALFADTHIHRRHKTIILIILLLTYSLIAQCILEYRLILGTPRPFLRTLVSIYGYCLRPTLVVLVYVIVADGKKTMLAWILDGINAVIYLTALFSPVTFRIAENNVFHRGPMGYTCHLVTAILLAYLIHQTIRMYGRIRRWDAAIPVFNSLLILAGVALDTLSIDDRPVSCLNVAIAISCALFYIWLHLRFVREHEEDLMAQQRIKLMLSQMKPHFLYNSLGAIEELCESDPRAAKEATAKFARYLRGSMDSLEQEGRIPFEKELAHTRLYLDLEQIRFEDALRVEYDVDCTDFMIPPLTLEPIAENAVRHGVRGRADGRGTVRLTTREYPDRWEIGVEDNGPGFDPRDIPEDGSHVGLRNVRERLRAICGGTLEIEVNEVGTLVRIVLPRDRGE